MNTTLIKEVIGVLEKFAPPALQETYDNSGLLVGSGNWEVKGVLVSLDITESILDEAIAEKCNLVVAHHPLIFSGIKRLNGANYVEQCIIKAIKHDIAIYCIHTNLDNVHQGVNAKIAEKLNLTNCRILSPKSGLLKKMVTFCPTASLESVRSAVFAAGAGSIGEYDECSYSGEGTGTFRASDKANPYVGKKNERHVEPETRIEFIYPSYLESSIITALKSAHPYEEVAYDLYPLSNQHGLIGSGMIGLLDQESDEMEFLKQVKERFEVSCLRYTKLLDKPVKTVAVCGGSGSFLLKDAIRAGADVFITADYKYHQFFDAENRIVIADIGHYESEQYTKELLFDLIRKNFSTFAVRFTKINSNPINYL